MAVPVKWGETNYLWSPQLSGVIGRMAQSKEYWRQYYLKNREKRRENHQKYYALNREKILAQSREYGSRPEVRARENLRDRTRYKTDPEYNARRREIARRYWANHKHEKAGCQGKYRDKKRAIVERAKIGKSCPCGEADPICLDFHHRDPESKVDTVSHMVAKAVSDERIVAEIAKCELICANCHRKLHRDGGY